MYSKGWAIRRGSVFKRAIHNSGKNSSKKGGKLDEDNIKSLSYQNTCNPTDTSDVEAVNSWKLLFPKSRYEATTLGSVERIFLEALDEQRKTSQKKPENSCFTESEEYGTGDLFSHLGLSVVHSQNFSKRLHSELSRAFDFGSLYNYFGSEEVIFQASPVTSVLDRVESSKKSPEYWYYYCTREENSIKNTPAPGLKVETQSASERFAADIFSAVDRYNRLVSNVKKSSIKYQPEEDSESESN